MQQRKYTKPGFENVAAVIKASAFAVRVEQLRTVGNLGVGRVAQSKKAYNRRDFKRMEG